MIFVVDFENQMDIFHAIEHGLTYTFSAVSVITLFLLYCIAVCVINMLLFESVFAFLAGYLRSAMH
jgi:hypothetical protein